MLLQAVLQAHSSLTGCKVCVVLEHTLDIGSRCSGMFIGLSLISAYQHYLGKEES